MATVTVNGREIEIGDDERLNGIQAAERAGVEIPYYCWHPGLSVTASCRMCLVEIGKRNPDTGKIAMLGKLAPACQTPAVDGAVFVTDSEKVKRARAMVEEDMLLGHPVDCPICDKAGECLLQDYHFEHGRPERRADIRPFTSRRRPIGETVTLFVDRCIKCSRCVRFTREIAGTSELLFAGRGSSEEIDVLPGYPLANRLSGNVVDLCPVGALGDVDFLYRQRVWFLTPHPGVCTRCSTGCSINVEENQDRIYRLKPRANPHVNQWWMCDEGRYGWKHVHDPRRNTELQRREGDRHVRVGWSELPGRLDADLRDAGRLAAVLSPHLTVEEAYLLAKYVRRIDRDALLAVGPAPVVGVDERFPTGFTIRAEKCPNRRGVEKIAAGMGGGPVSWDELPDRIKSGGIRGLWITGGYSGPWHDGPTAEKLAAGLSLLVVQDMFPSPLWERADYHLPGAAFAEREGSYVNHAGRLQSARRAVRPPAGVWPEGWLCWRLLEMPHLYDARQVLDELAREILHFAPAAEPVPEVGVDLKANQLAV